MNHSHPLTLGEAALLMAVVNLASFAACALAVVAVVRGVLKRKSKRSIWGAAGGCVAVLLGVAIVLRSDRPLPDFERRAFYLSAIAAALGSVGIILCWRTRQDSSRSPLLGAVSELAEEVREGRWQHLAGFDPHRASACEDLVAELRSRCPGHAREEYTKAIDDEFSVRSPETA